MKIKMRTTDVSPKGNFLAGSIRDLPAKEAKELVDAGYADYVKEEVIETATMPPAPETAALRSNKPEITQDTKTDISSDSASPKRTKSKK